MHVVQECMLKYEKTAPPRSGEEILKAVQAPARAARPRAPAAMAASSLLSDDELDWSLPSSRGRSSGRIAATPSAGLRRADEVAVVPLPRRPARPRRRSPQDAAQAMRFARSQKAHAGKAKRRAERVLADAKAIAKQALKWQIYETM